MSTNSRARSSSRVEVQTAEEAYQIVRGRYARKRHEVFSALILDKANRVIRIATLSVGGAHQATAHPRQVFAPALRAGANALILVHNHPSGDPTPSPMDRKTTRDLIRAGEIVGVAILDHLILGTDRYHSMRRDQDCFSRPLKFYPRVRF